MRKADRTRFRIINAVKNFIFDVLLYSYCCLTNTKVKLLFLAILNHFPLIIFSIFTQYKLVSVTLTLVIFLKPNTQVPQNQETPNFTAPEYKIISVTKQSDSIRKPVCKPEHTSGHDSFIRDESICAVICLQLQKSVLLA